MSTSKFIDNNPLVADPSISRNKFKNIRVAINRQVFSVRLITGDIFVYFKINFWFENPLRTTKQMKE